VSDLTVLAQTNGEVPVGELRRDGVDWHFVPAAHRWRPLSLLTTLPNLPWRSATPAYRRELVALLEFPWDCVILDHFASAHVLPWIAAWRRRHPDGRLLYVAHEHERTTRNEKYACYGGNLLRLLAMKIDGWKIGRWEDKILRTADIVSLINGAARHLFEASVPNGRYITTTPGYDGSRVEHRKIDASVPRRVALLGGRGSLHKQHVLVDWLDAAAERFARAGVDLDVIGDIGPALRETLQKRFPNVRFSGFVDDLTAHLQTCRLGVVPDTIGRGVKIRLASYIFARVPMAGFKGAIAGLPIRANHDFAEAPTLRALADTCIRLVDDFDRLNRLQNNAFAACEHGFDWTTRGQAIVEAIRNPPLRYRAMRHAAALADERPRVRWS
jgi:glycosyltransferase involved in cell wall biosynthesis